jgi:protein-S-isoprenylcysteine O-methyltransferase Ste14
MFANLSGAKKGLKRKVSGIVERPKTYLQKLPPNISAIILIATVFSIFQIGTLSNFISFSPEEYDNLIIYRVIGLIFYIVFSYLQVKAHKSLGESYSQDIAILKGHQLVTSGLYKNIRHPQYLSQILSDLGAGIALLSYVVIPLVILFEIPLFILRAQREDKILAKQFSEDYNKYKKRSGFFIPFIG